MNDLIVRYERLIPAKAPKRMIVTHVSFELVGDMRKRIDNGWIDEVVMVGPAACTGWRVLVNRNVSFRTRTAVDDQDEVAQNQAMARIVPAETKTLYLVRPSGLTTVVPVLGRAA